jgi:hypothetical protein
MANSHKRHQQCRKGAHSDVGFFFGLSPMARVSPETLVKNLLR